MNYQNLLSQRALDTKISPIVEIFAMLQGKTDMISFAPGTPDIALLPAELIAPLTNTVVEKYGRPILQYGLPQGFLPLREAVVPLLAKRGITATADDIHIGTGSSGALNNISMVLLNKGDVVLVERPTYLQAVQDFVAYETEVRDVESDDDGMLPAALEAELKRGAVKFIYLLPCFQNPTGRTMPLDRRKAIAELAVKYNVLIIEDDVYYDLRYKGEHLPAVYTFAPENTIYLGSVSKIFVPAVRSGYALMPRAILDKVLVMKQYIDMYTSWLTQAIAAEFLTTEYDKHLEHITKVYGEKMALMQKSLKAHMPEGFTWNDPDGGLFIWVTGPEGFDATKLLPKAIDAGVVFLPGSAFYVDPNEGKNIMRLSFAFPPADTIEEGVKRLVKAIGA